MVNLYRISVVVLVLTVYTLPLSAQTIFMEEEEIPITEVQLDIVAKTAEYAGDYHFGFSDGESELRLIVKGASVTGELSYNSYNERRNDFDKRTVRLKGGKVVGNMLVADGWAGIFVRYKEHRGLMLFKAPTDMIGLGREFGYRVYYEE